LRGDSDFRPKQACTAGAGSAFGASEGTPAAARAAIAENNAAEQVGDAANVNDAVTGTSADELAAHDHSAASAAVPAIAEASTSHVAVAAAQPARNPIAAEAAAIEAVAAAAVVQAERPLAALDDAPDAAAAAVAELFRVGVPTGMPLSKQSCSIQVA
jgi:hypothetical protein